MIAARCAGDSDSEIELGGCCNAAFNHLADAERAGLGDDLAAIGGICVGDVDGIVLIRVLDLAGGRGNINIVHLVLGVPAFRVGQSPFTDSPRGTDGETGERDGLAVLQRKRSLTVTVKRHTGVVGA